MFWATSLGCPFWHYANKMTIIISKSGKNAQKIDQSNFDKEDHLQQYIYENPSSIPLYDIKEDIKLLILIREYQTNSGPIDALGVDAEGNIYLVETKLYKNADKRTVVAQVLDYGASLWKRGSDFNDFTASMDQASQKFFHMPLNEKLEAFFGFDEEDLSLFWGNVRSNLNEGNFKFVVLMDKLHDRLKDLIVFLNQNSQFDLYAVELEYYKHESFEIIIPRLFGAEVKKDIAVKSSGSAKRNWTMEEIMKDAQQRLTKEQLRCFTRLSEFLQTSADEISFGTGIKAGSIKPRFLNVCPRSFLTVSSDGSLALYFNYLNDDEQRLQFYNALKQEKVSFAERIDPKNFADLYPKAAETLSNCEALMRAIANFVEAHSPQ